MASDVDVIRRRLERVRKHMAKLAVVEKALSAALTAELDLASTGNTLTEPGTSVNTTSMTGSSHALAISRAKTTRKDSFAEALYDAKLTQNGLAGKLGISAATLSRYRSGRAVPREIDAKVRELLPAWTGRWRGGIS